MIGYDHACDRAQVAFYRLQGSFVQHIMLCGRYSKIAEGNKGMFLTMDYCKKHSYYSAQCLSSLAYVNTSLQEVRFVPVIR